MWSWVVMDNIYFGMCVCVCVWCSKLDSGFYNVIGFDELVDLIF